MESESAEATRRRILEVAEERFAATGFAGSSVQDIVGATGCTKPVVYYYFGSKAGLFSAVLSEACDESYKLMRDAAKSGGSVEHQLIAIAKALFGFFRNRKALTRLAFSAAFATPEELPENFDHQSRRKRNFNFIHNIVKKGLADGSLDPKFDSRTLTYGIYGALSFYMMANVLLPGTRLDDATARRVVELFLRGARRKAK